MKELIRSVSLVFILASCTDHPTTPAGVDGPPSPRRNVNSESFWYDSTTGYFNWDGSPPEGDSGPAQVTQVVAFATAAKQNFQAIADVEMLLYGDYARLQLTYSESELASGVPTFGGTVDDGWKYQGWCSLNPMNPARCNHRYRIEQRWTSTANCGRRVSSSGTAKAKKGLPFGVSRDLVKIGGVSVPISLNVEWGESPSTAIPAASDVSPDCVVTPETCDDPFTEIVETECSGESGSGTPSGPGGSDLVGEFATIAWPSPSPSPSFQERWMCDVTIWRITNNTGMEYYDITVHRCFWQHG